MKKITEEKQHPKEPIYKGYMDLELMYWKKPTPDTSKFAVSYLLIKYSLN